MTKPSGEVGLLFDAPLIPPVCKLQVINKWLACNARSNLVSGANKTDVQAMSPSTIGKSSSGYSGFKDTE